MAASLVEAVFLLAVDIIEPDNGLIFEAIAYSLMALDVLVIKNEWPRRIELRVASASFGHSRGIIAKVRRVFPTRRGLHVW
jgi:hypothetical protein